MTEQRPPVPRVLIIDVHEDWREMLRDCCRLWGYEAATAADRGDVLAAVTAFRPDVVVLDLGLPAMADGLDVARRIRDAFFHKPMNPRDLREIIAHAVEHVSARTAKR